MLPRTLLLPLVLALTVGAESVFGDNFWGAKSNQDSRKRILRETQSESCRYIDNIDKNLISFKLFYGPAPDQFVKFAPLEADGIVNNLRWRRGVPVTVFIHDHYQSINTQPSRSVIAAYFDSTPAFNVLVVDWGDFTFLSYGVTVSALPHVARYVVAGLERLVLAGANVAQVVGHGVGAHLAGAVGRSMAKPLAQIIALDPAESLFYGPHRCERAVSATDAVCVQAVHTDAGGDGASRATATIDFFPNGGFHRQPGCHWWNLFDKYCSHNRALQMWMESLKMNNTLVGLKCQTWEAFQVKKCEFSEEKLQIGASCSGKKGSFYMWTNGNYPYGMGAKGATMGPKPNA